MALRLNPRAFAAWLTFPSWRESVRWMRYRSTSSRLISSSLAAPPEACARKPRSAARRRGRADALEISRFQNAQEFGLQVEWNVGNFVQEQGAAIGEFESPDAIGARIGKSTLYVTEELAFEDTFG